jgi:hypothetical protein
MSGRVQIKNPPEILRRVFIIIVSTFYQQQSPRLSEPMMVMKMMKRAEKHNQYLLAKGMS